MVGRTPRNKEAYKWYVLSILTVIYTLSILDQGVIGLLLQPIKDDLGLTDTQLGVLTGVGFGVVYAAAGVPAAYWADRGNRVAIGSTAMVLWGAAMMACLFARNFTQLVAARIAAAVGGSACMPPTYALLGDYFQEPVERSRAMTIYMLANPLTLLLGLAVGGWANMVFGWRVTLFALGIPALLVSALAALTVREPRFNYAETVNAQAKPVTEVLRPLWRGNSTRHLIMGLMLLYAVGLGLAPWYATFMMRTHGAGTAELGIWLGLIFGLGGTTGILWGGYVAARGLRTNERGQVRTIALAVALSAPCLALFLLLPGKVAALVAFVPFTVLANIFFGPTFTLLQRLVPNEIRATTVAMVMMLCNIIGMGLAPQLVGSLSDLLIRPFGNESLRYAMLAVSMLSLWSAYHFWRVGESVVQDLADAAHHLQCAANATSSRTGVFTKTPYEV